MADEETRAWVQNVETGQVVSIDAAGLAALVSPWREITAEQAMQSHMRSAR
jgi:hypothetical protein